MTYWTRAEYMRSNLGDRTEARQAHRRFWSQFVDDRTVAYVVASIGPEVLASSELARLGPDAGDVHLNDINERGYQGSPSNWDRAGMGAPKACKPSDVGLHGFSPSDLVCIAKEAARQHIEKRDAVSSTYRYRPSNVERDSADILAVLAPAHDLDPIDPYDPYDEDRPCPCGVSHTAAEHGYDPDREDTPS